MTKPAVLDIVNEIQQKVGKRFVRINWGGCGVFAAILCRELVRRGYDASIAVASWSATMVARPLDEIAKEVNDAGNVKTNWSQRGVYFSHIVVKLVDDQGNAWFIDSDQTTSAGKEILCSGDWYPAYVGTVDYKLIVPIVRRQYGWNEAFDRKQIPEMRQAMKDIAKALPKAQKPKTIDTSQHTLETS